MELGEILIIVFTGVVAGSTVAYAVLTWRLVAETRRLREAQTEPRVSMRLELAERVGHGGIELLIRNEGQGPAQNIRFHFQGDPTYFIGHGQQQPIDQIPLIENGLPYLGPLVRVSDFFWDGCSEKLLIVLTENPGPLR